MIVQLGVRLHELLGLGQWIRRTVRLIGFDPIGQRLQAFVFRDGRACAPLRAEGGKQVFQHRQRVSLVDLLLQCVGHQVSVLQGPCDRGAAVIHRLQLLHAITHGCNFHLVHLARLLFAIAGDERHSRAFAEQVGDSADVDGFDSEFTRDALDVGDVDFEFHVWGKFEGPVE